MNMDIIIYLRTSTTEQDPEKQKRECMDFAENKGYNVLEVISEQLSGFKDIERPGYNKIKEMARKGEIKGVVVWSLDRWVRNRDTLMEDVTILRNYGCKLHSVKDAWLESINIDGAMGRTITEFLLGLMGSLAELESQRKSDRVKMAYKSHKGGKWGRPSLHTNKKKIVLNLRVEGKSIRAIATEVNLSVGSVHKIIQETTTQIPLVLEGS